jgi:RNA polymerase primary sigma factor
LSQNKIPALSPRLYSAIPNPTQPMKNNPPLPVNASSWKAAQTPLPGDPLKAAPRTKATATTGRGNHITPEGLPEAENSLQPGTFQIYLNGIGANPLLSRAQEAALGSRIRARFDALLKHLLSSGRVGDILLERTRAEVTRVSCEPARRSALGAALARAESVLCNARECFVSGPVGPASLNAEVASAMGDLVGVLEIWPDQCLDLLEELEREFSDRFVSGTKAPESGSQREFIRNNLMDSETCSVFLATANRLRIAATVARNELVDANLRLVVATAKRMTHAYLSLEDLVQEGNLGLLTAAERFDERLGNRFSTFATRLIKSAMRRENDNQGRTIRLPVHRCDALRKLEDARGRIEGEIHMAASVEQLAEETGFSCGEVLELTELKQGTVSLDQKTGDEGEQTLGDFVPDPESLTPFYAKSETAGTLDPYLEHLADAQRTVVAYVYGIGDCPQLSLKETAERLGLQQAEARRLHQSALRALRSTIPFQPGSHGYVCAA